MGTRPVSSGGSSRTFVSPSPTGWPQLGQYRLAFGSRCPQVAQLAISVAQRGGGALSQRAAPRALGRGGGALSQRPDLRAIVRVGDLPGAVVELELLQSVEGTVALFGTRQPPLLRRVRLQEAIIDRSWLAQERQGDENDGRDGHDRADHEPSAHARTVTPS